MVPLILFNDCNKLKEFVFSSSLAVVASNAILLLTEKVDFGGRDSSQRSWWDRSSDGVFIDSKSMEDCRESAVRVSDGERDDLLPVDVGAIASVLSTLLSTLNDEVEAVGWRGD